MTDEEYKRKVDKLTTKLLENRNLLGKSRIDELLEAADSMEKLSAKMEEFNNEIPTIEKKIKQAINEEFGTQMKDLKTELKRLEQVALDLKSTCRK